MPTYEVRRRTVLTFSVVTAANETEARCLARDAWQQDAAIAALAADVTRRPNHDPAQIAAKRHPATWAAWKWLEQGEGKDRSAEEREYLAEKITELDRLLFELDEGSAYVV